VDFEKNSQLYAHPGLTEGVDYARRHRRHGRLDDSLARTCEVPRTTVVAPHGGGIEPGTSELCLAVAGYHPAALPQTPPAGVTYDYWMFEGVREGDNAPLHVPSIGCDDAMARSLCGGALNALALHGFRPEPELPAGTRVILVGGRNRTLREQLLAGFEATDLEAVDAAQHGELDGDDERNIVNRTLLGMGAQLEISTPLREAMFGEHTRPRRKHTTTEVFWTFVAVCRDALDRLEAGQPVA
jgi:phage replication-related protein YjqB (UPF0714/DUF867 family)